MKSEPSSPCRFTAEETDAGIFFRIDITLKLETSANLPEMTVDPVRLSQVLGNLIENALKHTSSGRQIIVTCQTGNLPEKTGEWLITTVRDTGCGIAPEDLPFVFERFYRTDQSRRARFRLIHC